MGKGGEEKVKLIRLVLVVAFMAAFTLGCFGFASKETKLKCTNCGTVFTVDQGIKAIDNQP